MYDVVVIGSGPGGYHAAILSAQKGMKTALVEKRLLGGVCLQEGCIPTKSLVFSAQVLKTVKEAASYGIEVREYSFSWTRIQERKDTVVRQLTQGLENLMQANGVEIIDGHAKITGHSTVEVISDTGCREIQGKNIILAPGSSPVIPPVQGIDSPGVMTSQEALTLAEIPRKMLVIGGGVIGTEFASIFGSFGCEVTVAECLPRILAPVDGEIARRMESELKRRKIRLLTAATVETIEPDGQHLNATINRNGKSETITVDRILVAAGRRPNTQDLGLENVGVKYDDRSGIEVDAFMQTSTPGIYAVGDVTGNYLLAHVASAEAHIAVESIVGRRRKMDYSAVPNAIFTDPEVAGVGLTEEEARGRGLEYKATKFMLSANSRAAIVGANRGMIKLITAAPDHKVVGAHIFGEHAAELIHELVLATGTGMSAEDIARTIHAHPTLSESIMETAGGALGNFIHMYSK